MLFCFFFRSHDLPKNQNTTKYWNPLEKYRNALYSLLLNYYEAKKIQRAKRPKTHFLKKKNYADIISQAYKMK